MIYFCIIIFLLIIFCILYLNVHQKKKLKFLQFFFFVAISTSVIYFIQGSPESLNFNKNLETEISEFITNENIEKLDSSKIILFLERELKDNPNDKEGWLILARTCLLSGHIQKADLYYKKGLDFFPNDEDILLEYASLKKNYNQTESAVKLITRLISVNPQNIIARKNLVELLIEQKRNTEAEKELKKLKKNYSLEETWLKKINEKLRKF